MRRDFVERDENKGALGEARVGDDKTGPTDNKVAIEQYVEIERAGAVGDAGGAVAAKVLLDEEQRAEQFEGRQIGLKGSSGVEEAGLSGEADRRGGVERGTGKHATKRSKARGRGSESGLWAALRRLRCLRPFRCRRCAYCPRVPRTAPGDEAEEIGKPNLLASLLENSSGWMH